MHSKYAYVSSLNVRKYKQMENTFEHLYICLIYLFIYVWKKKTSQSSYLPRYTWPQALTLKLLRPPVTF